MFSNKNIKTKGMELLKNARVVDTASTRGTTRIYDSTLSRNSDEPKRESFWDIAKPEKKSKDFFEWLNYTQPPNYADIIFKSSGNDIMDNKFKTLMEEKRLQIIEDMFSIDHDLNNKNTCESIKEKYKHQEKRNKKINPKDKEDLSQQNTKHPRKKKSTPTTKLPSPNRAAYAKPSEPTDLPKPKKSVVPNDLPNPIKNVVSKTKEPNDLPLPRAKTAPNTNEKKDLLNQKIINHKPELPPPPPVRNIEQKNDLPKIKVPSKPKEVGSPNPKKKVVPKADEPSILPLPKVKVPQISNQPSDPKIPKNIITQELPEPVPTQTPVRNIEHESKEDTIDFSTFDLEETESDLPPQVERPKYNVSGKRNRDK